MESSCLFEYGGRCVTAKDFAIALKKLGVYNGDTAMVHAGLQTFGKLAPGSSLKKICGPLVTVFRKSVGSRGTLVMPTFTWAFCRSGAFDTEKSPSEVGSFSEYFRTLPHVKRSNHPIYSVAAIGAKAKGLTNVGTDSFGEGSVFPKLHEENAIFLLVGGATFNNCTFLHHLEQAHRVPYRYIKKFKGMITDGSKTSTVEATYFVRPLKGAVDNDYSRLEKNLRRKKLLREVRVGASSISAVRAKDLFREGMQLLDNDEYALTDRSLGKK